MASVVTPADPESQGARMMRGTRVPCSKLVNFCAGGGIGGGKGVVAVRECGGGEGCSWCTALSTTPAPKEPGSEGRGHRAQAQGAGRSEGMDCRARGKGAGAGVTGRGCWQERGHGLPGTGKGCPQSTRLGARAHDAGASCTRQAGHGAAGREQTLHKPTHPALRAREAGSGSAEHPALRPCCEARSVNLSEEHTVRLPAHPPTPNQVDTRSRGGARCRDAGGAEARLDDVVTESDSGGRTSTSAFCCNRMFGVLDSPYSSAHTTTQRRRSLSLNDALLPRRIGNWHCVNYTCNENKYRIPPSIPGVWYPARPCRARCGVEVRAPVDPGSPAVFHPPPLVAFPTAARAASTTGLACTFNTSSA
jgi:hypothetical protein